MADSNAMILHARSQGLTVSAETLFLSFIENSNDGWCFRDLLKKTQYVNPAFCRWLGVSPSLIYPGCCLEEIHTALNPHTNIISSLESAVLADGCERSTVVPLMSPFDNKRTLCRLTFKTSYDLKGRVIGTAMSCSLYEPLLFQNPSLQLSPLRSSDKCISSPYDVFTVREWSSLWPLVIGFRKADIAASLNITDRHFNRLISSSMKKLGSDDFESLYSTVIQLELHKEIPNEIPYIICGIKGFY